MIVPCNNLLEQSHCGDHCSALFRGMRQEEAEVMAATENALAALKAHLVKSVYSKQYNTMPTLDNIRSLCACATWAWRWEDINISDDWRVTVCSTRRFGGWTRCYLLHISSNYANTIKSASDVLFWALGLHYWHLWNLHALPPWVHSLLMFYLCTLACGCTLLDPLFPA